MKEFVASVPEYRRTARGNYRHQLKDILMLVVLARLSKCVTRAEIIQFGKHNLKRLQSMGILRKGVPSEPTLCRVFNSLDAETMAGCMALFVDTFRREAKPAGQEIICIDGKATRGTTYEDGHHPDIVSAYSLQTGLTLATDLCEKKSNEIKSVPKLLDKIDIQGCTITADAMSFQKAIIDKIRQKGGDFVIELKANQRSLRYGLEDKIKTIAPTETYTEEPTLSHGRIVTRTCRIYRGDELIADKEKWNGNLTVIEILTDTVGKSAGQRTSEQRLYLSSLSSDAAELNEITRSHWSIECLHWGLDRNLKQDSIKRKSATSARNLDTIQRIVLNLVAIWKNRRKKVSDKKKGVAELTRNIASSLTRLLSFLRQK